MTSVNPAYTLLPPTVLKGTPPRESYWIGQSRARLGELITARRPQQAIPTPQEVAHDPALAATTALIQDHRIRRLVR